MDLFPSASVSIIFTAYLGGMTDLLVNHWPTILGVVGGIIVLLWLLFKAKEIFWLK